MSNEFKRTDRIAQTLLKNLAVLIQQEVSDPRLKGFITLSDVTVSKDLSHAKVYFTVFQDEPELAGQVLNAASSFLRAQLAKSMKLRIIPQLRFIYDESVEYGKNLRKLIDDANPDEE